MHSFEFRVATKEDSLGLIALLMECYGEEYYLEDLYHQDYLETQISNRYFTFYIAVNEENKPVCMHIQSPHGKDGTSVEIGTSITGKQYQRLGLSRQTLAFALEKIRLTHQIETVIIYNVSYHNNSQKNAEYFNLVPTAFWFGRGPASLRFLEPYQLRDSKIHNVITVKNIGFTKKLKVFIPEKEIPLIRDIYQTLSMDTTFCSQWEMPTESNSVYDKHISEIYKNRDYYIQSAGRDLEDIAAEITWAIKGKTDETATVFLNISNKNSVWACHVLEKYGFYGMGILPIAQQQQYFLYYKGGDYTIDIEDFRTTKQSRAFLDKIMEARD